MRAYLAEGIGTFAVVFAGTGAMVINATTGGAVTHVGVAMTFGLIVMAMIYSLGDISGAHFNPAVTIGFVLAGRFPSARILPYIASQLVGACIASGLLRMLFGMAGQLGATLPSGSEMQSFILEVILAAILMFVILNVATGSKEQGLMAGIAIGGTVGLEALFAGPMSGASMNPARSIAPALIGMHVQSLWIYIVAPMVGATIAVGLWSVLQSDRRDERARMDAPTSGSSGVPSDAGV